MTKEKPLAEKVWRSEILKERMKVISGRGIRTSGNFFFSEDVKEAVEEFERFIEEAGMYERAKYYDECLERFIKIFGEFK